MKLFLIEPGKPNQNAYIESFNGRFRDACLRAPVYQPDARQGGDRGVAAGIQWGETEEIARQADARRVCQATGRKSRYSNCRTLRPGATEDGVTSQLVVINKIIT